MSITHSHLIHYQYKNIKHRIYLCRLYTNAQRNIWPVASFNLLHFPLKEKETCPISAPFLQPCLTNWSLHVPVNTFDFCYLWHYNRGINDVIQQGMCFGPPYISFAFPSPSLWPRYQACLCLFCNHPSLHPLSFLSPSLLACGKVFHSTPRLTRMLALRSHGVWQTGWRRNLISKSGDKLPLQLKGSLSFLFMPIGRAL